MYIHSLPANKHKNTMFIEEQLCLLKTKLCLHYVYTIANYGFCLCPINIVLVQTTVTKKHSLDYKLWFLDKGKNHSFGPNDISETIVFCPN